MESQKTLFRRFIRNECTRQEIEALLAQFNSGNEGILREMIQEQLNKEDEITDLQLPDLSEKEKIIYATLLPHLKEKKSVRLWPRIAAAASILLFLSVGAYFIMHKQPVHQITKTNDIVPGGNKAVLTLANGKQIVLTSAKNGTIATQGNAMITKTADGQIAYQAMAQGASPSGKEIQYNTITTPIKGQYRVLLPDGSKVLLNAMSSLKYPTKFIGKDRIVELTGEAYFEVVHDKNHPFHVITQGQDVEDIGTHFNINAYDDEPSVKTTLLKGAVQVSLSGSKTQPALLKPGEQTLATPDHQLSIHAADTSAVVAWKDGNFIFRNQDLKTTMQQLARWYDVEIVYDDIPKDLRIGGNISRSRNLSVVLEAMQETGEIKFKIEGRKVRVSR
jgi:ferric-dicitrate binding protein FerR (iron transport regulator)